MKMKTIMAALGFSLLISGAAFGQGVIVPRPCHSCPPLPHAQPLPRVLKIKSLNINTKIDSQVATTKIEQVFENDTPYRLEGTYFFPIPESASLSDFAIYEGDKRIAGEVVDRTRAREIYNDLVRRMIDPGLLEYVGKDLFSANVFPIEPRSSKKIDLTYTQVSRAEGGTVSYVYPLGSGRRIQQLPIGQVAASIEINSPVDLKSIFSPSHKVSITRDGEKRARLSFEGSGEDAQKDFQLYYTLSDKEFGLSLLTQREPGKDGYFLMLISPKVSLSEEERLAKDIVFVLDTSGSMSGEKIEKARAALRFGVESLSPKDRFDIISFSGEEHLMKSGLIEASKEAKQEGLHFIHNLRAEGGTNINDSLIGALKLFRGNERPSMIVFITDGQPTVGVTDVSQIIKNASAANHANVRLFAFGVGYDVNTNLLDKLSADNRGTSDYIEPHEDLEVKISNFFAKVNYPVLSDLKLDFGGGVEIENIYPRSLPDLFRGSQLTLVGRYKSHSANCTVRLSGKMGSREQTFTFIERSFPAEKTGNEFLPRLWATRRVGYLLEQMRLNGQNKELVDEIVALGTRYGIVTPYTSYLVTDDIKVANSRPLPRDRSTRARVANAPGSGSGGLGSTIEQVTITGSADVAASKAEKSLRESEGINGADQTLATTRTVGDKTFLLKDNIWIDTEFKDGSRLSVVELKFGSDQFFATISEEPKLADYFALGEKVIVVFGGKVYKVE